MLDSAGICILGTIIAYLLIVLIIGFHYARKNESASDFYLGGRKLGPLVTAMSAEASDMSSYLLMGLPGLAYLSGLADVGWTAIGLAAGTYLNWLLTAKRLRRYTHVTRSFTIPQFFSNRYHDKKNILSVIAAVLIIIFFVPYTASGFAACGKLFHSLFGINYMTAMIIYHRLCTGNYHDNRNCVCACILNDLCRRCRSRDRQCTKSSGIPFLYTYLCSGKPECRTVQCIKNRIHTGMGTRIFRYATYSSSLHGN